MVDQTTGVTLIVIGVVLAALGALLPFVFLPLCGLGLLLVVTGIVVALVGQPRPVYYAAPPGAYPYPAPQAPACPICGTPLSWVPPYSRWYCPRCQAYR